MQHLLIKEGLAQHLIAMAVQRFQQPILAAGQAGSLGAAIDLKQLIIEPQAVRRGGDRCRRWPPVERHPPQDRFDAHPQLRHAERLGQIVIGAQAKAADAIRLGT
ncbi:hypothetical protein D3C81_2043150 [compost metagenome]